MSGPSLQSSEAVIFTLLLWAGLLTVIVRGLSRGRPRFSFALVAASAFVLRIGAAVLVSLTSIAGTLRGGDETVFIYQASVLSHKSLFASANLTALVKELYLWTFALQMRLLDSPQFALRTFQVGMSVAGSLLLVAAVYDLAGRRAARWAAVFILLEPGSAFFSSLIHKESFMYLSEGLCVYGCTRVWTTRSLRPIPLVVLGCLIAVASRPYAGWFIAVGTGCALFHASFRTGWPRIREARALCVGILVLALGFAPLVWSASDSQHLASLQNSQTSNSVGGSNLALEQVNFSSRTGIITNLPIRMFDVVLRPFPWQLGDVSQQLGLLGSLATLATLALLLPAAWRTRRTLMSRAGPLVYIAFFTICGYALSTGNAGTGFRYRTHFLLMLIALACALRAGVASD